MVLSSRGVKLTSLSIWLPPGPLHSTWTTKVAPSRFLLRMCPRFNEARQRVLRGALVPALTAIVATVGAGGVRAQPSFPAKPIHISIPYGAGGVADLTMRLLAQRSPSERSSRS